MQKSLFKCLLFVIQAMFYLSAANTAFGAEPDDARSIQTIWINSIKTSAANFGDKKAKELEREIDLIIKDKNEVHEEIRLPDLYWTICLKYDNGTKNVFCFFSKNEKWYMKTSDGRYYGNADVAEAYFSTAGSENRLDTFWGDTFVIEKNLDVDKRLEKQFETHDLVWHYVMERKRMQKAGLSDETAAEEVSKKIQNAAMLSMYAANHGYVCTDQEVRIRRNRVLLKIKEMDNADSFCDLFEKESGISYAEYLQKDAARLKYEILCEKMYHAKYDEF